ncbi:hypothetical protein [uncultured Chitinophaga sp.]|jgi:hypothetical protein|uniref:hypothetical protein n=1 Tax=uncultured Chitinophaga sp. TaxID=339340 RepID=UPI00261CBBEC|nr:hypothetical protein [uncultured Chitinophaga sp.]
MGLESYLFNIEFKDPVLEQDIIGLFERTGMKHLDDKFNKRTAENYGAYYFELRTENGLTEAHCILGPTASVLEDFSLRFSIVSPSTVIDQTFDLLRKLNDIRSIKVQDTEIKNHRYRQLRIAGKVDNWFRGLEGTDEEAEIEQSSYIEIDAEKFLQNQPGIMKRQIIANNDKGEVIEGGDKTIRFIEKKGLFHRFLGWIKNEL